MATTYEAIATVEVGSGGAATIAFTSIPGTYTDLKLVASTRDTNGTSTMVYSYNFKWFYNFYISTKP
jgi:hypothetical protein